jgi:RimJ/RimL family protein N-acetyltransferase
MDRRTELQMKSARLVLRPLRPSDADRVAAILSQPDVGRMLARISVPYPVDEARQWLESHEEERARGTAYRFGAVLDDRVIGCADVGAIADQTGELGFWFDQVCWGPRRSRGRRWSGCMRSRRCRGPRWRTGASARPIRGGSDVAAAAG